VRSKPEPAARPRLALITATATVALLAGCASGRILGYANHVESRYLGEPAARALSELGAPRDDRRVADLRNYVWTTGQDGALGGTCRLQLVADPRGVIVDYTISGTPLGCRRLLNLS
jgi:hypothetical protein